MAVNIGKKQNAKNILFNILAFAVQFVISFYISPTIVSRVGASAYGFIGLATDFVSYAAIIATVFNSVASRFIANAFYKKDYSTSNKYFNSLVVANLIIAGFLGLVGIILVPNLDKFLSIPISLVYDVKLTFALIFGSYIVTLITLVFTTSTFVTNRTDIQGIRNIIQYIVRFALIVVFLNFVSIRIYWIALATLVASIVVAVLNVNLTERLTPELKINIGVASRDYAFELAKSGAWMAITSISTILLRGLDLTVANIAIGDYEMGLLSVARTLPNNVTSIIGTIAPIFTPMFIVHYANNNIQCLVENVKSSVKSMALIMFVPVSGFIVFSYDFYSLWQKSLFEQELLLVTVLSTLTVVQAFFNATTATMAQISVVVNKLKIPVLVSLGCGIVSIVIELLLIKFTNMGLYAIVLSTTIVMILRYVFFNSMYAAWCLNQSPWCFIKDAVKSWMTIPLLMWMMYLIRLMIPVTSWLTFLIDVIICGVTGYAVMVLIFGRNEAKSIIEKVRKK